MHNWATTAAKAGICVFRQDPTAFWSLHDLLFFEQQTITQDNLTFRLGVFVERRKLNKVTFDHCMEEPQTFSAITSDIEAGRRNGVTSTPTLFVNGIKRDGVRTGEELKTLIRESMEHADINN